MLSRDQSGTGEPLRVELWRSTDPIEPVLGYDSAWSSSENYARSYMNLPVIPGKTYPRQWGGDGLFRAVVDIDRATLLDLRVDPWVQLRDLFGVDRDDRPDLLDYEFVGRLAPAYEARLGGTCPTSTRAESQVAEVFLGQPGEGGRRAAPLDSRRAQSVLSSGLGGPGHLASTGLQSLRSRPIRIVARDATFQRLAGAFTAATAAAHSRQLSGVVHAGAGAFRAYGDLNPERAAHAR